MAVPIGVGRSSINREYRARAAHGRQPAHHRWLYMAHNHLLRLHLCFEFLKQILAGVLLQCLQAELMRVSTLYVARVP